MKKVDINFLLISVLLVHSCQSAYGSETNQFTRYMVKNPDTGFTYKNQEDVFMNEAGRAGILVGRMNLEFTESILEKLTKANSITITEKTVE